MTNAQFKFITDTMASIARNPQNNREQVANAIENITKGALRSKEALR